MEDRLHKFAKLVESGSFTEAARELHMSQPALSTAIAKLERELHTPLLVRGGRELTLTEAGKVAYSHAKQLRVISDNLTTRLAELTQRPPSVAIGMIDSVASALFATSEYVAELESKAKVSIIVNNSHYLRQAVGHGELDIAFVTGPAAPNGLVEIEPAAIEPLVLVCHPSLVEVSTIAIQGGHLPQFISYDQTSTTRHLVEDSLLSLGIMPETTFFSTSPEVMLRLVLLQKGAAVLPYLMVKATLATGELSFLMNPQPIIVDRPISLLKRRGTTLAQPLRYVSAQVQRALEQQHADVSNLIYG